MLPHPDPAADNGKPAIRNTLYLQVLVGIVLGFLVLGEPIDGRMILGTALIIAGVALVNSRLGRQLVFARTSSDLASSSK